MKKEIPDSALLVIRDWYACEKECDFIPNTYIRYLTKIQDYLCERIDENKDSYEEVGNLLSALMEIKKEFQLFVE